MKTFIVQIEKTVIESFRVVAVDKRDALNRQELGDPEHVEFLEEKIEGLKRVIYLPYPAGE